MLASFTYRHDFPSNTILFSTFRVIILEKVTHVERDKGYSGSQYFPLLFFIYVTLNCEPWQPWNTHTHTLHYNLTPGRRAAHTHRTRIPGFSLSWSLL